jgi:hypothetical protein
MSRSYSTRASRKRKQTLLRAGIWAFIFVFAFSIVGGIMAVSFK